MPQPRQQDRSVSRCERSKSNHSKKQQARDRPFLHPQQLRSFEERQPSPHRQKHPQDPPCRRCETMMRKAREREQHFKQIVSVYHQEMDKLKEVNESLREQLEALHQEQQQTSQEVHELRRALADFQSLQSAVRDSQEVLRRRKELDLCVSPIEKGKEPIVIQRISERLLSQLDSPTFSQLLAGTPQPSKLRGEDGKEAELEAEEKENALRMQFDRLMGQCEATSNRSKKTTLRKQMASIANQLTHLAKG